MLPPLICRHRTCRDLPGEQTCRDHRDDRRQWDHEYDHHEQALQAGS